MNCKVFNDSKMTDAVWKFRTFEEPSLHYDNQSDGARTIGGWTLSRDERLARLITEDILQPGDTLTGTHDGMKVTATVTSGYSISVDAIRHVTPDAAARAATNNEVSVGWPFWTAGTEFGTGSLEELSVISDEEVVV